MTQQIVTWTLQKLESQSFPSPSPVSKKVSAAYSILVLEATSGERIACKTQAVTQSQTPKEIFAEETSPLCPQPQPPQVFLTPPPAPRVSPPCSDWGSTRRGGCFLGRLPVPRPSPSSAGADTKHAIAIPCFCTSQLGFLNSSHAPVQQICCFPLPAFLQAWGKGCCGDHLG